MNGMHLSVEDHEGNTIADKTGSLDPYASLVSKNGAAKVSCHTTHWVNTEGGGFTVRFEVGLTCDQDEETIERAGELAFQKAIEMTGICLQLMSGKKESPP